MQGRLSQKKNLPLQSFPKKTWKEEFARANKIGFKKLEWVIDLDNDYRNPIFSSSGREEIIKISKDNRIDIDSLCAHFLIKGGILKNSPNSKVIKEYFFELLKLAPIIGVKYVSIPFMEKLSLRENNIRQEIEILLKEIIEKFNICILIESDLASKELAHFINRINSKKIGILYDTGNAIKHNFSFNEDFNLIADKVKEIHFKDYSLEQKKSVRLGKGDTNFEEIFKTLKDHKWIGPIIFETPILENWEKEAINNLNYAEEIYELIYS